MQSYHLWPFVSGLFHSACCSQGLPMWSHVSVLPSLFKAEYYFVVGRGYTSFICSSTSGHLGCFHFSAVHWIICTLVYQRESCHISFHYLNFKRSGNLGWREHSQFWMETKPTSSAVTTVDTTLTSFSIDTAGVNNIFVSPKRVWLQVKIFQQQSPFHGFKNATGLGDNL